MTEATADPAPSNGAAAPRSRRRAVLGVLGAVLATAVVVWFVVIPWPLGLRAGDPGTTAVMEQRVREARRAGDTLEIRRTWMPLEEISPRLVRAVLVAEDHRFREHGGVDWRALAEEVRWAGDESFSWWSPDDLGALADAVAYVVEHRDSIRGRSTITQQLAKNLYFGTDRSLFRKATELVVAKRLEDRLTKDRILELYLNVAELGPGIFGAEAAARHYFGRSAADLSLEQAAALAATLPHPRTSNPARNPGRMRWRQNLILERLTGPPTAAPSVPVPRLEPGDLADSLPVPDAPRPADTLGLSGADTVIPPDTATGPDTVAVGLPDTLLPRAAR